eukprot:NODE_66_length_23959_cov_0.323009.p11 type:complete len:162 gc:universal NODE_66_length_23959_cov_0.323009:23558-23073(-)
MGNLITIIENYMVPIFDLPYTVQELKYQKVNCTNAAANKTNHGDNNTHSTDPINDSPAGPVYINRPRSNFGTYDKLIIAVVACGMVVVAVVIYIILCKRSKRNNRPTINTPFRNNQIESGASSTLAPVYSVQNSPELTPYSPVESYPTIPNSPQPQLLSAH